jgi:tRNA (cmo5U34)-methyltransferase
MKNMPKNWTFENPEVARQFDEHVREQLPWYELLTKGIGLIARHYISQGGLVYDVGASTGNIGREIEEVLIARNAELVAIEASKEMAALYDGPGELFRCDAVDFEYRDYDLAVVFLLFMFIAPGRRDGLLRKLVDRIKPGGALIVVDKVQVDDGYISTVMHRLTMFGKTLNGVSADEIVSKEMSLAGAQRPICPEEFFGGCRYHEFFRFGEFAGWILSK